jgi:hypothetical protein
LIPNSLPRSSGFRNGYFKSLFSNVPLKGGTGAMQSKLQGLSKFMRGNRFMKRLAIAVLVVLLLAVAGNAQTFRGAINGTVTDPSGASVPGAQVKATESATGIDHNTVTTNEGSFSFQDIPLGFYKVTVTAAGFPVYTVDKLQVSAGSVYTLSVKLTLQQQATTVEVSAAALTLDTTTATQNMTITSDLVQDVPLNGRDFTQLVAVAPGYGGYSVGGFGSMNGTRPNQMNWQIDGVDNNDFWHNIPAVNQGGVSGIAGTVLPIDSIDEFSAQTQSGPESGRNAGGTVNLVIKSGGNTVHGSVYYYNRNEFYSAKSPFFAPSTQVPKAPPLRNENYGFSVGGPILKNKTFYFVSYEKQDFIIGLSGKATEPSNAWIGQALDLLNNPGHKYGSYNPVASSTLSCAGASASGCTGGLMATGGLWPRDVIGSLSGTTGNFFSPIAEFGYSYNGVIKLDHQFNDKHHLYLRWIQGQGNQTAPTGGSPALGTASSNLKDYFEVAPLHVFNYSVVLNSTLSSRLTNQVLAGANYFNQLFHDFNNSFIPANIGLNLSPSATNHGKPIVGAPNIRISGFEQTGITDPKGRSDLTWHLTDIVSYNRGAHQFRFGGEIRQAHLNAFYHRHSTGTFRFDGSQGDQSQCTTNPNFIGCAWGVPSDPIRTVDPALCNSLCQGVDSTTKALADYLTGSVSSSSVAVGDPERWVKVNAFNLYFQDGWQATKKLTLTFGLRYEYFGPMHSDRKDISVFIPGTGFKTQGAGIASIFPPDKNNFAPRFGFSYQPNSKGDIVVRGSMGVFFDQINLNPFLDFRPPITASQGIQGNAFGPNGVSTFSRSGYNWGKDSAGQAQFGGASIFPALATCSDPNCLGLNDPQGLSAYSVNQNFRTPYFYNYDLQIEKSFGNAAVFQIGYVGSQGRKLNIISNINPADSNGVHHPLQQFGNILQMNSSGTSNYNSLQASYRIRSWHGLTSQFGYTWSHSLDIISEYRATLLDDATNPKLDYGNSDFDTRHLFTASFTYEVPKAAWAHGWSSKIVNGWQATSLWNFHTGQPFDEVRSYLNLIGNPFASGNGVTIDHKFSQANGGTLWVNPTAFCDPNAAGDGTCTGSSFGNIARNKFYGPGYASVDLSVFKNIPITERIKLQLRAEMFNTLNRINLASGVGSVAVGGGNSPNYNTCNQQPGAHTCSTLSGDGFGMVFDTIGDWNGAPGIGPGEQFNMQLVVKLIF